MKKYAVYLIHTEYVSLPDDSEQPLDEALEEAIGRVTLEDGIPPDFWISDTGDVYPDYD